MWLLNYFYFLTHPNLKLLLFSILVFCSFIINSVICLRFTSNPSIHHSIDLISINLSPTERLWRTTWESTTRRVTSNVPSVVKDSTASPCGIFTCERIVARHRTAVACVRRPTSTGTCTWRTWRRTIRACRLWFWVARGLWKRHCSKRASKVPKFEGKSSLHIMSANIDTLLWTISNFFLPHWRSMKCNFIYFDS